MQTRLETQKLDMQWLRIIARTAKQDPIATDFTANYIACWKISQILRIQQLKNCRPK